MYKVLPFKDLVAMTFDELNNEAQEKVISSRIDFWIELSKTDEHFAKQIQGALDEAERLKTPWFLSGIIYDMYKDEVVKDIKANHYFFNEEGNLLPILTHVDEKGEPVTYTLRINETMEQEVILQKIE